MLVATNSVTSASDTSVKNTHGPSYLQYKKHEKNLQDWRVKLVRTLNEKLLNENLDEGVASDNSRPSSRLRGHGTSLTSCCPHQRMGKPLDFVQLILKDGWLYHGNDYTQRHCI